MRAEGAFELSEFLEGENAQHQIEYIPSYGYVVRVREEAMNDEIEEKILSLYSRQAVHGVEYR